MASVALLALVMALFMEALVGWLASFRSTLAGVLLPSTSSCSTSSALVRLRGQPGGEAGAEARDGRGVGGDEALGGGQVELSLLPKRQP